MKKLTKLRRLITAWADARQEEDGARLCGRTWNMQNVQLALRETREKLDAELARIEGLLSGGKK